MVPIQLPDLLLIEGLHGNPESFFPKFFSVAHRFREQRGPDFPIIIAHAFFGSITPKNLELYIFQLEKLGIIIELNVSYRNFLYETTIFEYLAQASELRFSIGSDAHSGDSLGQVQAAWFFLERYDIPFRFFLAKEFGIT